MGFTVVGWLRNVKGAQRASLARVLLDPGLDGAPRGATDEGVNVRIHETLAELSVELGIRQVDRDDGAESMRAPTLGLPELARRIVEAGVEPFDEAVNVGSHVRAAAISEADQVLGLTLIGLDGEPNVGVFAP